MSAPAPHHRHDGHDHDGHDHEHPRGLWGRVRSVIRPHSHDSVDSIDAQLERSSEGIRAVKVSLVVLLGTALAQAVVVFFTGSVALLADTIHNFSDALTAVPLWIAFLLGRRPASRRYTYGYDRAEDLAGVVIVAMIALSAVVAGYESVRRLVDPQPISNIGMVIAAGLIGAAGNELVALPHPGRPEDRSAVLVDPGLGVVPAHAIAVDVHHRLLHDLPRLIDATVHVSPLADAGADHHAALAHHHPPAPTDRSTV